MRDGVESDFEQLEDDWRGMSQQKHTRAAGQLVQDQNILLIKRDILYETAFSTLLGCGIESMNDAIRK